MSPSKKQDQSSQLLEALLELARRYPKATMILLLVAALVFGGYYLYTNVLAPAVPTPPPTVAANTGTATTSPAGSTPAAAGSLPGWLQVYFTDPNPPDNVGKGIDNYVKKDIDAAKTSIDVASFDLNNPTLIDSLVAAQKRGLKVRVVYDGENGSLDLSNDMTGNKTYDTLAVLKKASVPYVNGGRTNGLMHNKMVIIDSAILYMGSWNLSYNDTYRNNNNLLRITDAQLIANYQGKFNQMFVDKLFGAKATYKALTPKLNIGGMAVENYFSPDDKVMDKLVAYVQGAKSKIHYMIFTYTAEDLANAMLARAKAGVKLEGVIENRGASQGVFPSLYCAKTPVRLDGNKYTMHHKVIIIDDAIVITGSFNFTKAADDSNDDNVLVLHSPAVAALYEQEFQKIYGAATTPAAADVKCGN